MFNVENQIKAPFTGDGYFQSITIAKIAPADL